MPAVVSKISPTRTTKSDEKRPVVGTAQIGTNGGAVRGVSDVRTWTASTGPFVVQGRRAHAECEEAKTIYFSANANDGLLRRGESYICIKTTIVSGLFCITDFDCECDCVFYTCTN